MSNYNEELGSLEKKKRDAIFETKSKTQDSLNAAKNASMPGEQVKSSAQKSSEYKSAYRQILEHDFTSQAWIGESAQKRKHRKNINSNYKNITGKKWTGLTSDEKNLRKTEFEDRRALSLKASGLVADLLTALNKNEALGDAEDLANIKSITDMDTSVFDYAGEGLDADRAFLEKFEKHMPLLHRGADLYDRLQEGSFPELEDEERMVAMAKLAYVKEVRAAYEDRIRIISSPYYVSLREKDFVGDAPENLEKIRKNKKKEAPLRAYAASVLRWRNNGLSMLQNRTLKDTEIGQNILEEDIRSRKKNATYVSDGAIDGLIKKLKVSSINAILNDKSDYVPVGMAMKPAREWVYADLKKKVSKEEINARLSEMLEIANKKIKHIEADQEKYREEVEATKNKNYEERKKENENLKYRVVTKDDVKIELAKLKKTYKHLSNVAKEFDAGEISPEVMKLWLDRGLQHDVRMGRQIYDGIVHQKYNPNREQDEPYGIAVNKLVRDYFQKLPGGVVTIQSSHTAFIRKEDEGKVTDKKALYKHIQSYPEKLGITTGDSDFVHIIGGKADSNNISTRAYISARHQYKSKAVGLFMETVKYYELQDKVYFKIVTKAHQGRYGMDDITVFFSNDVTVEERRKILDTFYEKCNKDGENILAGNDMCVTASKYKDGIALAPEPFVADILNELFLDDSKFNDIKRLRDAENKDSKVRPNFSYNTFITSMFCQSAITANYLMGKSVNTAINVADEKTIGHIKKIFRQLCYLNGVNPEKMIGIGAKSALE